MVRIASIRQSNLLYVSKLQRQADVNPFDFFHAKQLCYSACHTRVCDETKEHTADILIPRERAITLVF